ncbi:retinol dehydrogenase 12 [Xylariaceae sp. FL0255]|nr:retinol dehydrogenase 12 [Xylariaceae sp. FL0255]
MSIEKTQSATIAAAGDLIGKTAIVTGGNCGLGFECARQFLDRGLDKLILAVRDEAKGAAAKETLIAHCAGSAAIISLPAIEVWNLDYYSYDSILRFVARTQELTNLDIVVLNAGSYRLCHTTVPATSHEEGIQVNYLSTALLTILLLPVLEAKRSSQGLPGRLTLVNTEIAAKSKFKPKLKPKTTDDDDDYSLLKPLDSVPQSKKFDHYDQYCTSKLLAQFFVAELVRRVPASVAVVDCVNPGLCYGSRLARDGDGTWVGWLVGILFRIFGTSCAVGAKSLVDAAVAHDSSEVHGQYLDRGKISRFAPIVYTPEGQAIAHRLWKEMMTEFSFTDAEKIIDELSSRS